ATAEALIQHGTRDDVGLLYVDLGTKYKECMRDMKGRAPGLTCKVGLSSLRPLEKGGLNIPFNPRGVGCGASMRAMCIGLRYPKEEDIGQLIAVAMESGRMSHNHPTGYLGEQYLSVRGQWSLCFNDRHDALLYCAGSDWVKLCEHGALHGGDSDSTGVMACCWFGALYGFQGVPVCNYKDLEYKQRLMDCADGLYALSQI
ncbi:unnamed protein product, partial [Owenia fusiformis]